MKPNPPRTAPLATRLIRVVFGCYFLVAASLTALQMGIEYLEAHQRLQDDIAAMNRTFGPGLEDAAWRFNGAVIRGILTGMRELPAVIAVEMRDERGTHIDGFQRTGDADRRFGAPFSRTFPLVHEDETGRRHTLGTWTVRSHTGVALDRVWHTFKVVLINALIKTVMLWFIFAAVIRWMVGRPLAEIGRFVDRLDDRTLDAPPLVLRGGGHSELRSLAETLNTMVSRLRAAFATNAALTQDLRAANASLQARVEERTRELEAMAATDMLTGLYNRRVLDRALEVGAQRTGRLSLVLADIDQFKAINDDHGHKVGDAVLVGFADVLRAEMRAGDTFGRWGGEEFMLICPEAKLDGAIALAERLRRRIAETNLPFVGRRTCSFGVAELRPGETIDALVARADAALYAAKRNGRDRVEASRPSSDSARLDAA